MIYFTRRQGGGPIKIGSTTRLAARIRELEIKHRTKLEVLGTMPGGYIEEKSIQRKFVHLWIDGEWFIPDDGLIEFIGHACHGVADSGSVVGGFDNGDNLKTFTMADVREALKPNKDQWPGWLRGGAVTLVSGPYFVGKSFFLLDLTRRFWLGIEMPDGFQTPIPAGSPSLWILTDYKWDLMPRRMKDFGLPGEAVMVSDRWRVRERDRIEDRETIDQARQTIRSTRPAMMVIDSFEMGLDPNHSIYNHAHVVRAMIPWKKLAEESGIPLVVTAVGDKNKKGRPLDQHVAANSDIRIRIDATSNTQSSKFIQVTHSLVRQPKPLVASFSESGIKYAAAPTKIRRSR